MSTFASKLNKTGLQVYEQMPLHKYSSIKVGGNAKYFVDVKSTSQAEISYKLALEENIPFFILGGGSNVLISDSGFDGLVIKNSITGIDFIKKEQTQFNEQLARKQETAWTANLLSLDNIEFEKSENMLIFNIYSGTNLPYTITHTIEENATGLQIFAGIPGTIGGAIWNNIHGAKWLLGQFIKSITFLNEKGSLITKTPGELDFEYNSTWFKSHHAFILSAEFTLFEGGKERAREIANEWIARKKIQPKNSLGCAFSNLTQREMEKAGIENLSAGYVIDKILGLKGFKIGGVQVSESHSNFIIADSGAQAQDYYDLVEKIKRECHEKIGIELKEEIVKLGVFN
jgi:UDP-N-acetylmuramate dehydrogenase